MNMLNSQNQTGNHHPWSGKLHRTQCWYDQLFDITAVDRGPYNHGCTLLLIYTLC